MKENLISFETAKLAKEKGFDWVTIALYNEDGSMLDLKHALTKMPINLRVYSNIVYNWNSHDVSWFPTSAPTQSLLQKWLREVHGINIVIEQLDDNTFDGYLQGDFKDSEIDGEFAFGEKYEECLELLLIEALESINDTHKS